MMVEVSRGGFDLLYVSYIPLLTPPAGFTRTPDRREELMAMLTDAAQAYAIKAVAWVHPEKERPYPLVIVPYAEDIHQHMLEWSGNKPDRYFTLVWSQYGENGYILVILPDFDKSARRWHAITRKQDRLTIVGHLFTYTVVQSEGFKSDLLAGLNRIRVGFTSKTPAPNGDLENYAELTMRVRHFDQLTPGERETVTPYFNPSRH